jgi:hypothetical protein
MVRSTSRSSFLLEHDLFGKPVPTHRVKPEGKLFRITLQADPGCSQSAKIVFALDQDFRSTDHVLCGRETIARCGRETIARFEQENDAMLKLRYVIGALAALFVGAPPPAGAVPEPDISTRAAAADPVMSNAARVAATSAYQRWRWQRYNLKNLTPAQRHIEMMRRIQMQNQQEKAYFAQDKGPSWVNSPRPRIDDLKVLPGQQQIR